VKKFESIKKMGGSETSRRYLKELILELDDLLESYYKNNQIKQTANKTSRTPITLFIIMLVNYMLSSFFSFIWMGYVAVMFTFGFYASMAILVFWIFGKFKNEYRELNQCIDFVTGFIWNYVK
jgi:hypothetical protein